jgi:hypothetical protein
VVDAGAAEPGRQAHDGSASSALGADHLIATVAGQPIRSTDLERRMTALRHGPRGRHVPPEGAASADLRRWIVRELVTEATLLHEARAAGILDPGDTARALTPAVIGRLVDRATAAVAVDEVAIRAFYAQNPDRFRRPETRRISHAVLDDEDSARGVARALAGRQSIEAATSDASDRRAGRIHVESGRDLRRGEFVGAVEDAVFGGELGQVVGPIRTEHGWHVARVEAISDPTPIPFEEARRAIAADLLAEARIRAFEGWLEDRRTALAVVDPDYEHPADPAHGAAIHRH